MQFNHLILIFLQQLGNLKEMGIPKVKYGCIWWAVHGNLIDVKYLGGTTSVRYYSTKSDSTRSDSSNESTKDKLKRAVRDYGATVIVFHVSISITSLGICYAAVAR